MAIAVLDDVMLREPRLLVPGMQPLNRVVVDWTHPLARELRSFVIPGMADAVSLLPMSIAPTTLKAGPLGLAAQGATRATWTAKNVSLASNYSMFCCYASTSSAQVTAALYQAYISSINRVNLSSYWDAADLKFTAVEAGSSYILQAGLGKRPTDRLTVYGVTVTTDGYVTNYYNGVAYGTGTDTRSIIAGLATQINLGTDGGTGVHASYSVYSGAFWQRLLSPTEIEAFSADPYQFLIPA